MAKTNKLGVFKKKIMGTKANCNWWQYSRWIYLIGRSVKMKSFTDDEFNAGCQFILQMKENRTALIPKLMNKVGNKVGNDFTSVDDFENENELTVAKMIQVIGRNMKVIPPTEAEKGYCDALFAATDPRRFKKIVQTIVSEGTEDTSDEDDTEAIEDDTTTPSNETIINNEEENLEP